MRSLNRYPYLLSYAYGRDKVGIRAYPYPYRDRAPRIPIHTISIWCLGEAPYGRVGAQGEARDLTETLLSGGPVEEDREIRTDHSCSRRAARQRLSSRTRLPICRSQRGVGLRPGARLGPKEWRASRGRRRWKRSLRLFERQTTGQRPNESAGQETRTERVACEDHSVRLVGREGGPHCREDVRRRASLKVPEPRVDFHAGSARTYATQESEIAR